jgi:3-methylcrotonyl-CoA carboxylase alpha subunit
VFTKLLIANRGEIACRVARTARRMGIRTVAVYSDADANAAHVAACDEAVRIGGPRPQDSYLNGAAILEAARRTGAEAIHPGYGFLSENAEFATACAKAGKVFIGPPPEAIAAMGSKSAAKALMEKADVPLTPGYHGDIQDTGYLLKQAQQIRFPVLIKAVSGGGGKGMRRVDRSEDFADALASCQREAQASFGDARVLVERYLERSRHIEVQVFGDLQGNYVYLFERDCSVQRRHQKVIEEAPAPGMTPRRRMEMGEAAVAAAAAVGYVGAGTVEFIVAPSGEFYFMEMNTRLQVEHPVTEMITGLDLVEWQLKVAAGERLPLLQTQLAIMGHAMEARIYAEDPAQGFLPSIGKLEYLATPAESDVVRIDTGVRQGDEITPYYDPMIAKLIVHGATRDIALERMRAALAEYRIVGVSTNVQFLERLTTAKSFVSGAVDTALIEREQAHLFPEALPPARDAWLAAALGFLLGDRARSASGASPWADISGWRLAARATREWQVHSGDHSAALRVEYGAQEIFVTLDDRRARLRWQVRGEQTLDLFVDDTDGVREIDVTHVRVGTRLHLFLSGEHRVFERLNPYLPSNPEADAHAGLRAPMPGRILLVNVKPGDTVARGAPLVVMEAMKMEHTITAPAAGAVEKVLCSVGEQVREGAELLVLTKPG